MTPKIPTDVQQFMKAIEGYAKKAFPKGTFAWKAEGSLANGLRPHALYIRMTTENKKDWPNGIINNDPSFNTWWIHDAFTDEGLLPKLKVEMSQGGRVHGPNATNAMKVGWRNKTGTSDQVLRHFNAYFIKLRAVYDAHPGLQERGLRAATLRLAHDVPELRQHLIPLLKAAKEESFEDYVKGKKFPSPKTGDKVQFGSLPKDTQAKIREHWQEANERGSEEDSEHGEEELLDEYNLKIVGNDKKRAVYVAKKIQAGIGKTADICEMSPPVCEGNLGISRDNMPQVMDKSVKALLASKKESDQKKGKAAVEAGADPESDKPIMDLLLDDLKKKGVKIEHDKVSVQDLKATQREIKAGKTFGMADAYYKGDFDPASDVEIVISSDGHILDGHHRWASLLVADPDRKMSVIRVDKPMKEFLKESMEFPGVFRADLQDNIIPKDTPLDLGGAGGDKKKDKGKKDKKKASLKEAVLRLAHDVPELRQHLIPLLREAKADPMLTVTPEFEAEETAPASYWLKSWGSMSAARSAIQKAMRGQTGSWGGPRGMMFVSPAKPGARSAAATTKKEWQKALKDDEAYLKKIKGYIKILEGGGKVDNLTLANAKANLVGVMETIAAKKRLLKKLTD